MAPVVVIDARCCDRDTLLARVKAQAPLDRVIVVGLADGLLRRALLKLGCGDVLPPCADAAELELRVSRVAERLEMLPRRRVVGPLTLDLRYRDVWHAHRWLNLFPREFELLWRLADSPGTVVTRQELLRDVWRISQEPETNSVEVHVSRLRARLAGAGCAGLVVTVPEGGYRLLDRPLARLLGDPA